jgi:bla regulator protein blaR1
MAGKISLGRKLLMAIIGITAFSGPIVFGFMNAPRVRAQRAQTAEAPLPSFEVASIKPNHTGGRGRFFSTPDPGRLTATNVTTKMVIEFAYNVKDFQLAGGPEWINSESYDINAKLEDSATEELEKLPEDQRRDKIRLMMQSLLADRFKLTLAREKKELPIYALVVAKGGPKLTPTAYTPPDPNGPKPSGPPQNDPQLMLSRGKISAVAASISGLADILALLPDLGDRLVVDQTGITGKYDFTVEFTQENFTPKGPQSVESAPPPDASAPSIFTALQEQLGLRLESTKGPVDTIVIEHIEEPSEN